jgi:hypothetical protein
MERLFAADASSFQNKPRKEKKKSWVWNEVGAGHPATANKVA